MLNLKQQVNIKTKLGENADILDTLNYDWRTKDYDKLLAIIENLSERSTLETWLQKYDDCTLLHEIHSVKSLGRFLFAKEYEKAYAIMCDYGVENFINYHDFAFEGFANGSLNGYFTKQGFVMVED